MSRRFLTKEQKCVYVWLYSQFHTFQLVVLMWLISSALKAGFSQLCQKFTLFALILLVLCLMHLVNIELVSFESARIYMHRRPHCRFIYISCWLIHRGDTGVQNKWRLTKLQLQGSFEVQEIFHLMPNFYPTTCFPTKVYYFFPEQCFIFPCALPVALPNTLLEEDTIKLIIGFLCGLFSPLARKTSNEPWLTSIFSTYLYLHCDCDWILRLITRDSAITGEVDKSNYHKVPKA